MGKLHLDSVDRISNIPLVEKSVKRVENLYSKVKTNNRLFHWYFDTAEATILAAIESVQPAVKLFESPIRQLDNVLCKSLDILEERIPLVYLPPEMMYWNTKEYMSDRLVKPVLKRADSVKQIRNAVLESSLTTYAADRLDGAFTAGDKLVDKYLMPLDVGQDQTDGQNAEDDDNNAAAAAANEHGAMKAIHHGQRFSRKLKRRLTQRTILEARALKKQSKEAIHILLYAAELIATDPKQALAKAKELWAYLSQDEPENQARPVTLEQLIVLISRESARRVVHLVNFSATLAAKVPKTLATTSTEVVHQMIYINKRLFVITKLDKVTNISKNEAESAVKRMVTFYDNLQGMTQIYLERLARFLSGRIEAEKIDNLSSNARRSAMALLSAPPSTTSTAPARRFENNPQEPHINGLC